MNIVSANWMPLLRLAGAVEMPVERPMDVEWVTGVTFPVVGRTMLNVSFLHAETVSKSMEFLICPPGVGVELVIGWGHVKKGGWSTLEPEITLLSRLETLLKIQQTHGLTTSANAETGNIRFMAMDGEFVNTDDLLWPDKDGPVVEEQWELPKLGSALDPEQSKEVEGLLEDFKDVFDPKLAKEGANVAPMKIEMVPEWTPPQRQPLRKYTPAVTAAIQQELDEQLAAGILEKSEALSGSPVHMVVKPSSLSGYRFCIDFSKLNKSVVSHPYPLPNIQAVLDSAGGAQFFALLDLRQGYWQFPVEPESRSILSVQVLGEVYQQARVAMGFVDASFYVQSTVEKGMGPLIGKGVSVYLDDIFIYALTFREFFNLLGKCSRGCV